MTATVVQRDVLIVSCGVSAGIHAGLAPGHAREATAAGVGFALSALVLGAVCVALTRRQESVWAVTLAAATLAGLVAAYAAATTTGVPVLHPEPEPADGLGLATKAIELIGLSTALALLARGRPVGRLTRLQPKGTTR